TRRPVSLALRLRYPGWATEGLRVSVNGRPQKVSSKPGSFVELRRNWKNGDRIELEIPMQLRFGPTPDHTARTAILYGPTVRAGERDDPSASGPMLAPALITEDRPITEWIKPV